MLMTRSALRCTLASKPRLSAITVGIQPTCLQSQSLANKSQFWYQSPHLQLSLTPVDVVSLHRACCFTIPPPQPRTTLLLTLVARRATGTAVVEPMISEY